MITDVSEAPKNGSPSVSACSVYTLLVACALSIGACSGRRDTPAPPTGTRAATQAVSAPTASSTPALFDADGNLLPSDVEFMGFAIPRGFEAVSSSSGRFIYRSRTVPYTKLGTYVERRLASSTLVPVGREGLMYRDARVRDAEPTDHNFEVRVLTVPGAVELWLSDTPPVVFPAGTTERDRVREMNEAYRREHE